MASAVNSLHVSRNEFYALDSNAYRLTRVLAANTAEIFDVPTNATFVAFASNADFYVQYFDAGQDTDIALNGAFLTMASWVVGAGWSIGAGVATASGAISTDMYEAIPETALIAGQAYSVAFDCTRSAGSVTVNLGGTAGTARSSTATFTETIVAGADGTLRFTTSGFTGTIDNVTCTLVMAVPSVDINLGAGMDLNPTQRKISATKIGLIAPATTIVTMTFFKE